MYRHHAIEITAAPETARRRLESLLATRSASIGGHHLPAWRQQERRRHT